MCAVQKVDKKEFMLDLGLVNNMTSELSRITYFKTIFFKQLHLWLVHTFYLLAVDTLVDQ